MITEEQIRSGCVLWYANKSDRSVHRSSFNSNSVDSKIRLVLYSDSDYFASREEAEECLLKHLLERLNDN